MDFLEFIKAVPVIGILRDIPRGSEGACAMTAAACGLKAIEVTMNTADAESIIAALKQAARPFDIKVGAGTVRHESDLKKALAAGAEFIVTRTPATKSSATPTRRASRLSPAHSRRRSAEGI